MSEFQGARVRVGNAGLNGTGLNAGEKADLYSRLGVLEGRVVPAVLSDLTDIDLTGLADGDLLMWDADGGPESEGAFVAYTPAAINIAFVMPYVIDGGGVAITTGLRYGFRVNFAGKVTGWNIGADQNTTSSVQVWKDTTANFPPTVDDLILTMSTVAGTRHGSATGLNIAFSSGDWFYFNVSVNDNATVLLPEINCTREVGP